MDTLTIALSGFAALHHHDKIHGLRPSRLMSSKGLAPAHGNLRLLNLQRAAPARSAARVRRSVYRVHRSMSSQPAEAPKKLRYADVSQELMIVRAQFIEYVIGRHQSHGPHLPWHLPWQAGPRRRPRARDPACHRRRMYQTHGNWLRSGRIQESR